MKAPFVGTVVLEHRVVADEILEAIFTANDRQFVAKSFALFYIFLGPELVTTTQYHR